MSSGASEPLPFSPGEILDGRFRVERVLGSGGVGYVVAAWHLQLDQPVALKFLRPESRADPSFVARFQREARATAKLRGEHTCRIHDVGDSPTFGPYMVMELLDGVDLRQVLKQRGPLPVVEALTFVLQACHALGEAHGRGIVHRDIKPANLLLSRRPDGTSIVKLVDFGLSKLETPTGDGAQPALTVPSMIMGSLPYLSPEQFLNPLEVDHRVDIWALGVTAYELLANARPFGGSQPTQLLMGIMREPPPPLARFRADLPPGLEAALLPCLAKSRDDRYGTVAELARALAPFVPGSDKLVESIERLCAAKLAAATMSPSAPGSRPSGAAMPATAPPVPPGAAALLHALASVGGPSGTLVLEEPAAALAANAVVPSEPALVPSGISAAGRAAPFFPPAAPTMPRTVQRRRGAWALMASAVALTLALGALGTGWFLHRRPSVVGQAAAGAGTASSAEQVASVAGAAAPDGAQGPSRASAVVPSEGVPPSDWFGPGASATAAATAASATAAMPLASSARAPGTVPHAPATAKGPLDR